MHDQHWESNPRPSDLEANALLTRPCASDTNTMILYIVFHSEERGVLITEL